MKLFAKFLLMFWVLVSQAQVGGESIYQFLNISTAARQIALGGETLTLVDNVNQPMYNPATINEKMDNQLSVNYTRYLAGITIGSVSYAKKISERYGVLHSSIQYLDYGTLIGANEQGLETGNFNASDIAISVGYALTLPIKDMYFGANLKFINSSIASFSSVGLATDVALLYNNSTKPFVVTLVFRNIGTQIKTFNGLRENLPFKVALGASYKLKYVPLKWYGTIDNLQQWDVSVSNPSNQTIDLDGTVTEESISFFNNMFRHVIVGAELFPERAINLRIGYNFRRSQELALQNVRTFNGLSVGFGLKMRRYKLNYAYSNVHTASNVSTFSLQINLDQKD